MEISLFGFVMGLLLLAIPLYFVYALNLQRMRKLLTSIALMIASVVATGVATYLLMKWNNTALLLLSAVIMALAGAVFTLRKAQLNVVKMIVPVGSGMLLSVILIGLYMLFLVMGLKNPFDARYFVPVMGLLAGGTIGLNAYGLHTYYMGLHHHSQLYYYLLGNGSNHRQATNYFFRRAFQAALNPIMRFMSGVVLTNAPVIMLALVIGGMSVWSAMALQILLFVAVLAVSFSSLFITLIMARRYCFDDYEKLKNMTKGERATALVSPVSETSTNLSEPRHTDFESRPSEE